MASLKEIFEKAQKTGQVEYTFFGGGTSITPFNQTSLPFGNDEDYGRGSSKQPYRAFKVIEDNVGDGLGYDPSPKYRQNDPVGVFNTGLAAARDLNRITRFFTDVPNGPIWLGKQSILQLTNPDTSYKSVEGRITSDDKISQLEGPRFYNPLGTNTLAQVTGEAVGLHFTRHGLSPIEDTGYLSLNTTTPGGIDFQSRLLLYKNKLEGFDGNGTLTLNKYQSGPDAIYGIGNTQISAYKDSFGLNTGETDKGAFYSQEDQQQYNGFIPWSYTDLKNYSRNVKEGTLTRYPGNGTENKFIQDFRQENNFPQSENYPKFNIHSRIGVTTGQNAIGTPNTVDSINVLTITPRSVFYGNSNKATNPMSEVGTDLIYSGLYDAGEVKSKTNGKYGRDIIKFRIELLNNDQPVFDGVINTDVLAFRAYLGDLSDDITPTWKSFNYMGRGEDFYVYEKFSRSINFSFFIFAHSEYEMPAIYTKLNYLMSSMAPDYNSYGQMRGTYAYLTIGDYVYQQPGVFTKMNISNLLDAPWEIALEEPENRGDGTRDTKQHEVPKYLKVNMSFNAIHNFLPRKNKRDKEHTATFITPNFKIGHPNRYLPQNSINISTPQQNTFGPQLPGFQPDNRVRPATPFTDLSKSRISTLITI